MSAISIERRFNGPPSSANGGYFAGRVGNLSPELLTVRLMKPPPLVTEMQMVATGAGACEVRHGSELIAQGRPGELELKVPSPPQYLQAVEASRHYYGFRHHALPTCFVCGVARERGDGMRIFAGPVEGRKLVAAAWVPEPFLDRGDGKVRPEFMVAALDCPGYAAVDPGTGLKLLGEITAHVDRCVYVGEPCVIIGWQIGAQGRKHIAGTAVFDNDGELCGQAQAVWIEVKDASLFT